MTTRNMTKVRALESKLELALDELQNKNKLCSKLLEEREECEREVELILNRNTTLKNEMATLFTDYNKVIEQRDQLQTQLEKYIECNSIYEQALSRISHLERELQKAQDNIQQFEEEKRTQQSKKTMNMYNSLVSCEVKQHTSQMSRRTRKKYLKFIKTIRKYSFMSKNMKILYKNYLRVKKQNCIAIDELDLYKTKLQINLAKHNANSYEMQCKIEKLQGSLHDMTKKYTSAQQQIQGHISAANELVDLCTYNEERVHSLINKQTCNCGLNAFSDSTVENSLTLCNPYSISENFSQEKYCKDLYLNNNKSKPKVILFSDDIGTGMGGNLCKYLNYNIINNCLPQATISHITEKIKETNTDRNSTIVLLLGNCKNVKKSDIIKCIDCLISKTCKKVILCAFPYSKHYTENKNKYIYYLNNFIFHLTCRHSDKLFYFDINKFINEYVITKGTIYLQNKYKRDIAKLLAYNIVIFYNNCNLYTNLTKTKDVVNIANDIIDKEILSCKAEDTLLVNSNRKNIGHTPDLN